MSVSRKRKNRPKTPKLLAEESVDSLNRLKGMGFQEDDPFWRTAEKKPNLVDETYSEPPEYDKIIMNKNESAALLAPLGGGKTAGRLRLTASLKNDQEKAVRDLRRGESPSFLPLIAHYTDFEGIGKLPSIDDHRPLLLGTIAGSIYEFISAFHELFLNLTIQDREFWWAFLETHRRGTFIFYDLPVSLSEDFKRNSSRSSPIPDGTSLYDTLDVVVKRLHRLHITSLFILIDDVDSYTYNSEQILLDGFLGPLLNNLKLFSLPDVIWKFFLPDNLYETVRNSYSFKSGRLGSDILRIKWDENKLSKFLSDRLSWASDGKIEKITQHCNQDLITKLGSLDIDARLVEMALRHTRLGPPRALLELVDILYHCGDQIQITILNWDNFIFQVQDDLYKDTFVESVYRSMIVSVVDEKDGAIVGSGFITRFRERTFIITCAHVIKVLNKHENDTLKLGRMIIANEDFLGRVLWYHPPEEKNAENWSAFEDVCVIESLSDLKLKEMLPLATVFEKEKYEGDSGCFCFGYPVGMGPRGSWFRDISCKKSDGADFILLAQAKGTQIDHGVSGAPLYSPHSSRIIGIIQSISEGDSGIAYLIPSYIIQKVLEILTQPKQIGGSI